MFYICYLFYKDSVKKENESCDLDEDNCNKDENLECKLYMDKYNMTTQEHSYVMCNNGVGMCMKKTSNR